MEKELDTVSAKETHSILHTDSAKETQALETDSTKMTQAQETDSAKETHCFSGMHSCQNAPNVIILFKRVDDSEEPGYFWKLNQIFRSPSFFMPQNSRSTSGRITKFISMTTALQKWLPLGEMPGQPSMKCMCACSWLITRFHWSHRPTTASYQLPKWKTLLPLFSFFATVWTNWKLLHCS